MCPCCQNKFVKNATIYYSGPPQDSSLSTGKSRDLPSKAVLRCIGGDLSAVVPSASRRPRPSFCLRVGR